jgi:Ca-activated chloride channel family protein
MEPKNVGFRVRLGITLLGKAFASHVRGMRVTSCVSGLGVLALLTSVVSLRGQQPDPQSPESDTFRFRSGIELVNVTATVSDRNGHFVAGLTSDDFLVYEDDRPQTITHFSAERVPVSLGFVVDSSGSMAGEKVRAARGALGRFFDLLDAIDELFLYRFSDAPVLLQGWTSDRHVLSRAIGRLDADGGTAMYDAVAEAVPLAASGQHRKKAIVIISDGNDTSSRIRVGDLKRLIRETEVLVYAVGIDGDAEPRFRRPPTRPVPIPMPFPPGRRGRWPQPPIGGQIPNGFPSSRLDDRVNVLALRELTDESGGRTEIIRSAHDLAPATTGIADELSRQYYLGYPTSGVRDGRWRQIRVEVKNTKYRVRARRGYFAN